MSSPGFRPTHVVPRDGMPAWEAPDPARPTVSLDPLLPVRLTDRRGDWGRVECANGWSAWVDGRALVAVPDDPPTTGGPLDTSADPRPLLTRAEQALAGYRSAVEDLVTGALDGETFQHRTQGLRLGVVADGTSLWLYDPERTRWLYTDGRSLATYAPDDTPATNPAPPHTPGPAPAPGEPPPAPAPGLPPAEAPPAEAPPATRPAPAPAEAPPTTVDPGSGYAPTRIVTPEEKRG